MLEIVKPTDGGSPGIWGNQINTALDAIVNAINSGVGGGLTQAQVLALIANYGPILDRTSARPSVTSVIWTGGTAGTPPANAVDGDIWIHS